MQKKLLGLAAAGALALATPAAATNGMRMIGFGAVQNSMGGVGVGATLDACSIASNPAGLGALGHRLDASMSWFKPTVSYRATGVAPGQIVMQDGASLDSSRGGSPIPAIAWVRPVNERLTAGVGVFGIAGMGVDYPVNLYAGRTFTSYLQGRLTPGVSYQLTDWLAVGGTVNLMMAQMKYDVAAGFGQAAHDTATSFGIGATLGVKARPTPWLELGAAWESRSSFQDFSFDVPARPNPMQPGTTIPGGTDKLAFDQPQVFTLGVGVRPVEPLLVAVDVQWINWSATMGKGLPKYSNDATATGAMPFDMRWSDQWVTKVGLQWSPTRALDLRAGWNYGKMPLDPDRAFENLAFPAVSEHHFTAGVGYAATRSWGVNVGAMYAPEVKLSGANAAGQYLSSYETKMSQWELDLAAVYRF